MLRWLILPLLILPSLVFAQGASVLIPTGAGDRYLKPVNNAWGLLFPGIATSTTGCLAISANGWIFPSGSACGSGGGGGSVATSTNETRGFLSYWTSTNATPATLGKVATTSLTATSPLSLSQAISVIGSSASALSIDTSGTWTGNAGTASALAANASNCSAGSAAGGVTAAGAAEDCTDYWTEAENTSAAYISDGNTNWDNSYGFIASTRALTVAGTANQISSSAGSQDLSADRTWTLSLPSHIIFPSSFQATAATTTHATSTNHDITGLFTFNGVTGNSWDDFCTAITGGAGLCDGIDDSGGGSGSFPFSADSNYGQVVYSTSTPTLWFKSGVFASSTSRFVYASTTALSATTLFGALVGNADTATALAANGSNCSAGSFPLGVDASGAAESCTDAWTEAENTSAGYATRSSFSASTPIMYNSGTGAFSWVGLATTSQPSSSNLLVSNGAAGVYGVATSSATINSPLSGTLTVLGSGQSLSIANAAADGSTKGAASFAANDFDASSGNISIDYTNGQAASGSNKGFLTSADWTTFNGKESVLTFNWPLVRSTNTISFNATTSPWAANQFVYTNAAGLLVSVASSSLALPNTALANSTISGIALGANLADLTATNSTLTFSGTYNGSTARTIGLTLSNGNVWTAASTTFAGGVHILNGTTTNATSTNLKVSGQLNIGLNCTGNSNGGALTADANGVVSCSDDDGGAGGGVSFGKTWEIDTAGQLAPTTTRAVSIPTWLSLNDLTLAYASSTNSVTVFGLSAGGDAATTSATQTFATAFGNLALSVNATGGLRNTAIGYRAGTRITTGDDNTALGANAGNANSTANRLTAVGSSALGSAVGASNTALGYSAGYGIIVGTNNTMIGDSAGGLFNDGSSNVFVGYQAGGGGTGNVAIGVDAGGANAGYYNLFLGHSAASSFSSGSNNIFIGPRLNGGTESGNNNITLGTNTFFSAATGDNRLNIGNLIYGTIPATTTAFTLPSSGLLGIGSTSPYSKLSIHTNNGDTATTLFAIGSSTASATTTHFVITNTGYVGVATSSPTNIFSVTGNALIRGSMNIDGGTGSVSNAIRFGAGSSGAFEFIGDGANSASFGANIYQNPRLYFATGSGLVEALTILNSNQYVGVGTTSPSQHLSVHGNTLISGNLTVAGLIATSSINFGDAVSLEIPNGTGNTFSDIGQIAFDTTDNQFLVGTSTQNNPRVIPTIHRLWGATVASTSPDLISGGRIWLPPQRDGFVVKEIHCAVDGGTSIVINISNSGGTTDSETVTCDADGATDTDITTNPVYTAGSLNSLELGTKTGTVDYLTFSVWGVYTRE